MCVRKGVRDVHGDVLDCVHGDVYTHEHHAQNTFESVNNLHSNMYCHVHDVRGNAFARV